MNGQRPTYVNISLDPESKYCEIQPYYISAAVVLYIQPIGLSCAHSKYPLGCNIKNWIKIEFQVRISGVAKPTIVFCQHPSWEEIAHKSPNFIVPLGILSARKQLVKRETM